jgi:hypothetical protein
MTGSRGITTSTLRASNAVGWYVQRWGCRWVEMKLRRSASGMHGVLGSSISSVLSRFALYNHPLGGRF